MSKKPDGVVGYCCKVEHIPHTERKIRPRMIGYEKLVGYIERVPLTWLPALLITVVQTCNRMGVFKDRAGFKKFVQKAWDDA